MTDEKLKKIVEETIGNDDPYWNEPVFNVVKKIINLPENTETTISELIDDDSKTYSKFMLDVNDSVMEVCKKINIVLDKSKHSDQSIEPFNVPFIKKTLSNDIMNIEPESSTEYIYVYDGNIHVSNDIMSIVPESLKQHVYVHNGNIYAKQKLPRELEQEYELFISKLKQFKCPNCGETSTFLMTDEKF